MRMSSRRTAVATVATVVAGLSLVPLTATPASAAVGPVEKAFVIADTDGDGFYGLHARTTPNGTLTKVFELDTLDVSDLTSSADGSRIAYIQDTYNSLGDQVREQVVVRDVSSRQVRVVEDIPASDTTFDFRPVLSPDGNTVMWTRLGLTPTSVSLTTRKAVVGAGAATQFANGYSVAAFASSTTVLAQNLSGTIVSIPAAGGSPAATSGFPVDADGITVSVDGTHVAWALDQSTSSADIAQIQVATLTTGGTVTAGAPTSLTSTLNNREPAFSRDGTTVYFVRNNGTGGNGDVWSAPADAGTPAAVVVATAADDADVAIATTDDGTLPGDATAGTATLMGTSALVRWTLPADADLSGVIVKRSLGATLQKAFYVPAPLTSAVDSGLVLGSTYTYTFTSIDRSGNLAATPATHQLTAVKAGAIFADPTSNTSTKTWFPVRFAAGSVPSSVHFTVSYLRPFVGTYSTWVTDQPGATRFFGTPATATQAATTSVAGGNYRFRVVATDSFGNTSSVAVSGWAVVPYDQTKASYSGGVTNTISSAYLGSYRVLKTPATYARISFTGLRLQIVGSRCASCGVFDVYVGTTRIGTVDTYRSSTLQRSVLFTKSFGSGTKVVTIVPRGTAGRPNVILDGFGIRVL